MSEGLSKNSQQTSISRSSASVTTYLDVLEFSGGTAMRGAKIFAMRGTKIFATE